MLKQILQAVIKCFIFLSLLLSAIWLGFVLWFHFSEHPVFKGILSVVAVSVAFTAFCSYLRRHAHWQRFLLAYVALWIAVATWYVTLPAQQDKAWQPEVARLLSVTRNKSNPNVVTLHNVRDFSWGRSDNVDVRVKSMTPTFEKLAEGAEGIEIIEERWIDRTVDLSKLSGLDVINSYWMGPKVGHTLISFRFEGDRPLTFSIEIRKEEGESFSALGGFFRQFEMSLIAAEERDILYTRSNVRGEQAYLLPIQGATKEDVRGLFESYLNKAESLEAQAQWYNTLTSNCTNVVFEMARKVSGGRLPIDYRIWMSGLLPEYLFDTGFLPNSATDNNPVEGLDDNIDDNRNDNRTKSWTIEQWYQQAYMNPKVSTLSPEKNRNSYEYSKLIRQDLPQPTFDDDNNLKVLN